MFQGNFKISNFIDSADRKYPSLIIVFVIFTTVLPVYNNFSWVCLLVYYISTNLILFIISGNWRVVKKIILWFCIALIILIPSRYKYEQQRFSPALGSKYFKATVIDFNAIGNNSLDLENPKSLILEFTGFRYDIKSQWVLFKSRAMAYLNDSSLKIGDSLYLKGTLQLPRPDYFSKAFSYKNYLRSKGIGFIFYGEVLEKREPSTLYSKALSGISDVRLFLLKNLTADIADNNIKSLISALILGFRNNIDKSIKDSFSSSGISHILAISGLHVGILSIIILIILRPFPVRIRYSFIPPVLFFYVLLTGMQTSSVRAFIMITIFALFRSMLIAGKPINNILFAAVIILLINPMQVFTAGFQYSFLITSFLIMTWRVIEQWNLSIFEQNDWIVNKHTGTLGLFKNTFYRKSTLIFLGCLVAFISSLGLNSYYNQPVNILSPITNLIVMPLLLPLCLLAVIKIALSIFNITPVIFILNYLIHFLGSVIIEVSKFFESNSHYLSFGKYTSISVIIFYISVVVFFLLKCRKTKVLFLVIIMPIFIIGYFWINYRSDQVNIYLVQSKCYSIPSILIINNFNKSAVIVNPTGNSGYFLQDLLKEESINNIKEIFIGKSNKEICAGAGMLIKFFETDRISLKEKIRNSKYLKKLKSEGKNDNLFFNQNNSSNLIYSFHHNPYELKIKSNSSEFEIVIRELLPGEYIVNSSINGSSPNNIRYRYSNKTQLIKL